MTKRADATPGMPTSEFSHAQIAEFQLCWDAMVSDARNDDGERIAPRLWADLRRREIEEWMTYRRLLRALRRGSCWCEVAIGNPNCRGQHDPVCAELLALFGTEGK